PNEVVRTETGCIPSLPPGTDLLAAGGHKTRPYDFGGILGVTTNLTGRNFLFTLRENGGTKVKKKRRRP
ncbi:MAG: hypothetical protein IKR05_10415, partial [Prevotella sp.]|nr:hypothetical protein [Prevotella sp.]